MGFTRGEGDGVATEVEAGRTGIKYEAAKNSAGHKIVVRRGAARATEQQDVLR